MMFNILDNTTTELWMTKYIIGEIFSPGGATLYKNPSDQIVLGNFLIENSNFSGKSKAQKLKDAQKVRDNAPNKGSIGYSFVQILRLEGHNKAAFVVDKIRKNPGELGPRLAAFVKQENHPEKWSSLDVLADFFDRDLSVSDYKAHRKNVNKSSGIKSWPSWNTLANEKRKCCPDSILQTDENTIQCSMQNVSHSIY